MNSVTINFNQKRRLTEDTIRDNSISTFIVNHPGCYSKTIRSITLINDTNGDRISFLMAHSPKLDALHLKEKLFYLLSQSTCFDSFKEKFKQVGLRNEWVWIEPSKDLELTELISDSTPMLTFEYGVWEILDIRVPRKGTSKLKHPTPQYMSDNSICIPNFIANNCVVREVGDSLFLLYSDKLIIKNPLARYRKFNKEPSKVVAYPIVGSVKVIPKEFIIAKLPEVVDSTTHYFVNPRTNTFHYRPQQISKHVVMAAPDNAEDGFSLKIKDGDFLYTDKSKKVIFNSGLLDVATDYNRNYVHLFDFGLKAIPVDKQQYLTEKGFCNALT